MREAIVARRAVLAAAAIAVMSRWADAQPAGVHATHPAARHPPHPHHAARRLTAIALDPGHGGIDPGAISPRGYYEKNITLATARELARLLDATGRYRPMLTRNGDSFVPLRERVLRARRFGAELFLSIHANALPDSGSRGLSVYTLSEDASDRETAALALRENKDNFVTDLRLSRQPREIGAILLELARRQTSNRSLMLAHAIVDELGRTVPLLEKPQRAAGFAVLGALDIPSALVELGCLSNPEEERLLPQPAYQHRLALGLLRAIDDYFAAAVRA